MSGVVVVALDESSLFIGGWRDAAAARAPVKAAAAGAPSFVTDTCPGGKGLARIK